MKLLLFFKSRRRIIERYLAIKKENNSLRDKIAKLEQQVALYKLHEIAVRKKLSPQ